MTDRVTFPAATGEASGVLVAPAGTARVPAVVVIHEWWGVNAQIQTVAERWAKEGFLAIVPDLFHGFVAKNADEAGKKMGSLDFAKAVQEIAGAVTYIAAHPRSTGKVAVTGYCMGGALTLASACTVPGLAAAVAYYGLPPGADWTKVTAPLQAHFASHDDWATVAGAKNIQAALAAQHKTMELHVYDAQHAFANDQRPEVYNAAATQQAWGRSVAFVRQHAT